MRPIAPVSENIISFTARTYDVNRFKYKKDKKYYPLEVQSLEHRCFFLEVKVFYLRYGPRNVYQECEHSAYNCLIHSVPGLTINQATFIKLYLNFNRYNQNQSRDLIAHFNISSFLLLFSFNYIMQSFNTNLLYKIRFTKYSLNSQ